MNSIANALRSASIKKLTVKGTHSSLVQHRYMASLYPRDGDARDTVKFMLSSIQSFETLELIDFGTEDERYSHFMDELSKMPSSFWDTIHTFSVVHVTPDIQFIPSLLDEGSLPKGLNTLKLRRLCSRGTRWYLNTVASQGTHITQVDLVNCIMTLDSYEQLNKIMHSPEHGVTHVRLERLKIHDILEVKHLIRMIQRSTTLTSLTIESCMFVRPVPAIILAAASNHPSLRQLHLIDLRSTQASTTNFKHIRGRSQFSDMDPLVKITLTHLSMISCQLNDVDVKALSTILQQLTHNIEVDLSRNYAIGYNSTDHMMGMHHIQWKIHGTSVPIVCRRMVEQPHYTFYSHVPEECALLIVDMVNRVPNKIN